MKQIHAVGLLTMAVLGSGCVWLASLNSSLRNSIHENYSALSKVQAILATVEDHETGYRGYALSGRGDFLQPWERAREVMPEMLFGLRCDMQDNSALMAQFESIVKIVSKLFRNGDAAVKRISAGHRLDPALMLTAKREMDTFRQQIAQLDHERRLELRQREARAAEMVTWLNATIVVIFVFGIFYFCLSFFWLRHLARARQASQEAYRRVQAQITRIFRYAKDGMGYLQPDGRIVEVNDAYCALTGHSREDLLNKTCLEITPPEYREKQAEALRRVLANGEAVDIEKEYVRPDGKRLPVLLSLFGIPDAEGRITAVGGIAKDMTERHAWESALKESEARLRTLNNVVPAGLFRTDHHGLILYANECWAEIVGLPQSRLNGARLWNCIHPDDRARVQGTWFQPTEPAKVSAEAVSTEFRILRPDGSVAWVISRTVKEYDARGAFVGFVGTLTDITERRDMEEKLREQSRDLARSNGELERFAYVASHDLKEPLRMIRAYLSLLAQNEQGKLDEQSREYLRYAMDGAVRLRVMVSDLLAYSRAGQDEVPIRTTESAYCLRDALRHLQPMLEEKHARIHAEPLPPVLASPGLLTQLFQNLVHNAVKFSRQPDPVVEIRARRVRNEWRFEVRDFGVGIADGNLQTIFEMFRRLHGPDIGGTGIGLATCKRIVERFGGRIWAESSEGQGSTFFFTLPATPRTSTLDACLPVDIVETPTRPLTVAN